MSLLFLDTTTCIVLTEFTCTHMQRGVVVVVVIVIIISAAMASAELWREMMACLSHAVRAATRRAVSNGLATGLVVGTTRRVWCCP